MSLVFTVAGKFEAICLPSESGGASNSIFTGRKGIVRSGSMAEAVSVSWAISCDETVRVIPGGNGAERHLGGDSARARKLPQASPRANPHPRFAVYKVR